MGNNYEPSVTCSILRVFTTILSVLIGGAEWMGLLLLLKNSGLSTEETP